MDTNNDGTLSKLEIKNSGFLDDYEFDEEFDKIDTDGSGKIEFEEFVAAIMDEREL